MSGGPNIRAVLAKIRDGVTPSNDEIIQFTNGLSSGDVSDAQAGAFAMAVLLNPLQMPARVALTLAMRDSGDVLNWDLNGPIVDKHSTGGVGDAVSLILAPALAACGAYVPMISGRGLGHTGGTLDKLDAIAGLKTNVDTAQFKQIVGDVGCAIVSATTRVAPADKRLYAVRDVTATVGSIDLITASILSKKLAGGIGNLVLDVKVGTGAVMQNMDDARALAKSLVDTANGAGCTTTALITDMNQPLASCLGNALEIMEVVEVLTGGHVQNPMAQVAISLGGEALVLSGLARDVTAGEAQISAAITCGAAAEKFGQMISAQGGPADFTECWRDRLPAAPVVRDVMGDKTGFIQAIDGVALGMAVVQLGGGRMRETDRINPSVGLGHVARLGDAVDEFTPLAIVHAATDDTADRAVSAVRAALTIGAKRLQARPLIQDRIS